MHFIAINLINKPQLGYCVLLRIDVNANTGCIYSGQPEKFFPPPSKILPCFCGFLGGI